MSRWKALLLLSVSASLLSACGKLGIKMGFDVIHADMPIDESTPPQASKISDTLNKISQLASSQGLSTNFRALPVIVTSQNLGPGGHYAFCSLDADGNGKYIAVSSKVFNHEGRTKGASLLFSVLLHEIGHCYFHRSHDDRAVGKDGFRVEVDEDDDDGSIDRFSFDKFPVSIMSTNLRSFGTPSILEAYYVKEIVGKFEVRSADDVEHLSGVHFIPL